MNRHPQHFQCPACRGRLTAGAAELTCGTCGNRYALVDGSIVDFVGGRFDTRLDPHHYDTDHGITDRRSAADYRNIRRRLGPRWPTSLGSMVEVGCGTGAFSRAVLAKHDVRDIVLTDVSLDMLRICKAHLERLGVAANLPMTLATYSTNERCFRAASFDSCVGIQVLHHVPDYAAFLEDLFRFLKPGGVAFFAEPALRFHQAVAAAMAEIVAGDMAWDPAPSQDRQLLHNWISEQRRGTLHQGALEFLAGLEDKHMFVPAEFAETARRIGFATTEAFPLVPDPAGAKMVGGLVRQLGLSAAGAAATLRVLPHHARPYLRALPPEDRTASYLFWLAKPASGRAGGPRCKAKPIAGAGERAPAAAMDIHPAHWFLELRAQPGRDSLTVVVDGWCLLNSDVRWLRVRIAGVTRDTPVWYPRPDVHAAFNGDGRYAAWNSLCCGVTDTLVFDGVPTQVEALPLTLQLVLMNGFIVDLPVDRFRPAQPLFLKR